MSGERVHLPEVFRITISLPLAVPFLQSVSLILLSNFGVYSRFTWRDDLRLRCELR